MTRFVVLALLAFIGSAHAQPALIGPCMNNVSAGCSLTAPVIAGGTYTGGAINNTPIGNLTPSTGSFSTLGATGAASLLGGGTHAGTFTGGTFSGATWSAGTFSGTQAGTLTLSGTLNAQGGTANFGTNTVAATNNINGPASTNKLIRFQTAGVNTWQIFNTTADGLSIQPFVAGVNQGTLLTASNAGVISIDPNSAFASGSFTVKVPSTFTKALTLGSSYTYSGTQGPSNASDWWTNLTVSGTAADSGGATGLNLIQVTDNVVGQITGGRSMLFFNLIQGAGSVASSWAMDTYGKAPNTTGDFAAGGSMGVGAGRFSGDVSATQGGTATALFGAVWGQNVVATATGPATFINAIRGIEINMAIKTGASVGAKEGLKITGHETSDVNRGLLDESFITMGAALSTGAATWRHGIEMGVGLAIWPFATDSTILDVGNFDQSYTAAAGHPANFGLDANLADFTTAFLRMNSSNGPWFVDPNGNMWVGSCGYQQTSTGNTIGCSGSIATAETVNAGGTGWVVGNFFSFGVGGRGIVTGVSGGAVTTFTIVRQPYITSGAGAATLAATAVSVGVPVRGAGLVLNVTWDATRTKLTLNPSGNTLVGTGSALATNATSGFLQVATMAGAPTGTVGAAGQAAIVVDTTNKKICYSTGGGTWECSGAFTP